ncbi:MAG: hypothetical protein HYS13_02755 [Planctomycetia bacterium]|nr:hypothetical protein [Planctomycetia bacterium]
MPVLLIVVIIAIVGAASAVVGALFVWDYSSRSSWRGALEKLSEGGHFSEEEPAADVDVPDKLMTFKEVHEKLGQPAETYSKEAYTVDVYRWPGLFYTYVIKVDYHGKGDHAGAVKVRPRSIRRGDRERDVLPDFFPSDTRPMPPVGAEDGAPPSPVAPDAGRRPPEQVEPPQAEPRQAAPPEVERGEFQPGGFERGRGGGRRGPRRDQGRNFI